MNSGVRNSSPVIAGSPFGSANRRLSEITEEDRLVGWN